MKEMSFILLLKDGRDLDQGRREEITGRRMT